MGLILDRLGKQLGPTLKHAVPAKVMTGKKAKRKKRKDGRYGK